MCECCKNEETLDKVYYDFTYVDQYGLATHICKEDLLFDEETELPQLLKFFKNFLLSCGFSLVDEVVAKNIKESNKEISSFF